MAVITCGDEGLRIELKRWEALSAMHQSFTVPWEQVQGAHVDAKALRVGLGLRVPGAWIPGVVVAGSFYWRGVWSLAFWQRGQQPVVIDLTYKRWSRLVIGTSNAASLVAAINARLPR